MNDSVTRTELEARFQEERRLTQQWIKEASITQQTGLDSALVSVRQSIRELSVKIDNSLVQRDRDMDAVRDDVDAARHNAALALGGFDALKSMLREVTDELKQDNLQRAQELRTLVTAQGVTIARWQGYERAAGGVVSLALQLPVLRWLGSLVKWVFAAGAGIGLGAAIAAAIAQLG